MKSMLFAASIVVPGLAFGAVAAPPGVGDLAITAINGDEDGFALVTFVDLLAGSQLMITDNEWNGLPVGGGGDFNSDEGVLTWMLGADLAAGSVVRFASVDSASEISVSFGTVSRSGGLRIAVSDDSLTIYRDDLGHALPLSAIGYGASFLPAAGLDAATVTFSGGVDFAEYAGARSGADQMLAYSQNVFDASNWTVRAGTQEANTLPDMTAFSVMAAPVPEADSYAMMLAGLGLVSVMARRRLRA